MKIKQHHVDRVRKGEACIEHTFTIIDNKLLVKLINHIFPLDHNKPMGTSKYYFKSSVVADTWTDSINLPSGMVAIPLKDFFVQEEKKKEEFIVGEKYIIDEGFANSGEVVLLEITGDHYCLVKEPNDIREGAWRTMLNRLSQPKQEVDKVEGERILCAAIWYKDLPTQNMLAKNQDRGLLICAHRHGQCIDIVKSLAGLRTVSFGPDAVGETEQGFLTNTNRFVNREEALHIAIIANQLIERTGTDKTRLFSEDLY